MPLKLSFLFIHLMLICITTCFIEGSVKNHLLSLRFVVCSRFIFLILCLLSPYFACGYFLQCNTEQYQECFAVELLILAIWKKALDISVSWRASTTEAELPGGASVDESTFSREVVGLSRAEKQKIDFTEPSSVFLWAEQGFIFAVNHAEKLSCHIPSMDSRASFVF